MARSLLGLSLWQCPANRHGFYCGGTRGHWVGGAFHKTGAFCSHLFAVFLFCAQARCVAYGLVLSHPATGVAFGPLWKQVGPLARPV